MSCDTWLTADNLAQIKESDVAMIMKGEQCAVQWQVEHRDVSKHYCAEGSSY